MYLFIYLILALAVLHTLGLYEPVFVICDLSEELKVTKETGK